MERYDVSPEALAIFGLIDEAEYLRLTEHYGPQRKGPLPPKPKSKRAAGQLARWAKWRAQHSSGKPPSGKPPSGKPASRKPSK